MRRGSCETEPAVADRGPLQRRMRSWNTFEAFPRTSGERAGGFDQLARVQARSSSAAAPWITR